MFDLLKSYAKRAPGFLQRRYHRLKNYLDYRGLRKLIREFKVQYPDLIVSLLDVGARRGIEGRYDALVRLKDFLVEGIEPDKQEANALLARGPYRRVHTVAVADEIGSRPLYVTKVLGCTSIHKPKAERLNRYSISTWFEIQAQTNISVTTLDSLYNHGEEFDFISMDVQGAEYEVMKGGERLFDQALGISLEVHFSEVYEGQKLFPQVHDYCLSKGFRLILMGCCDFDGEVVEAECVYVRDHQLLRSKDEVLKCILFSLNWHNKAYVENVLRNVSDDLLSPAEKAQIRCVLKIKEKKKSVPWPDGFSARVYGDGSGYR